MPATIWSLSFKLMVMLLPDSVPTKLAVVAQIIDPETLSVPDKLFPICVIRPVSVVVIGYMLEYVVNCQ
jgi:hypothetical protein